MTLLRVIVKRRNMIGHLLRNVSWFSTLLEGMTERCVIRGRQSQESVDEIKETRKLRK